MIALLDFQTAEDQPEKMTNEVERKTLRSFPLDFPRQSPHQRILLDRRPEY